MYYSTCIALCKLREAKSTGNARLDPQRVVNTGILTV